MASDSGNRPSNSGTIQAPSTSSERPTTHGKAAPDGGDAIAPEQFDEEGYLHLNPDVQRAIELGQAASGYVHYVLYGRAEGRPLPGARNRMIAATEGARGVVASGKVRCSVDSLIVAPNCGLIVVGWIDDKLYPLKLIRIEGPDWRAALDSCRFIRWRRADVEQDLRSHLHAFGFFAFLQFERGGDSPGPIQVELSQEGGLSTTLSCTPQMVDDVELREIAFGLLAGATFPGDSTIEAIRSLGHGIGDEVVRFNKALTRRIVATPYVERFGPLRQSARGTVIVCLYGKPEFFFLQQCLFSGSPEIEDYEFVYVSNSPELAGPLLREAHCAELTYGLTSSVVILGGNAGFGAANNAAARIARTGRLLAVNPDVFPRDPDWARKHSALLKAAPVERTRLFGVPLYYDDGSLMHGGMYFEVDSAVSTASKQPSPLRVCRTEHYGKGAPPETPEFLRPRPVPAVTGAFMSIDRSWFEALGGFSEDFVFGHYEDADLCLRSIEQGTAPWLQDIRMWHLEGKGSTRRPVHEGGSIVNRWLFSRNWLAAIENGLRGPRPTHPLIQMRGSVPLSEEGEGSGPRTDRQRNGAA